MIKVESIYEVVSSKEVIEHRRLVTPWFFVRLNRNSYKKIECMVEFWMLPCAIPFIGWEKNNKTLVVGDDSEHLDFITSEFPVENDAQTPNTSSN